MPPGWLLASLLLTTLLVLPVIVILAGVLKPTGPAWSHVVDNLLLGYSLNTMLLALSVGITTLLIGVSTAWLVVRYEFHGRRFLQWALMAPLAMPSYISAFTYAGMLDYFSPIQQAATAFGLPFYLRDVIASFWGAAFILSFTLYPYVYLTARSSFLRQSSTYLEVARTLGKTPFATFREIALPLARPAIAGGLMLVLMETLNDYGVSAYYGVDTFSTGIFKAWFGLDDIDAAIRLSGLLLLFIAALIGLEYGQRGKSRYTTKRGIEKPLQRHSLSYIPKVLAMLCCFLPVLIGFLLPAIQLLLWSFSTNLTAASYQLFTLAGNSILVAIACSIIVILVSLVITYSAKLSRSRIGKWLSRISILGYSVPGVVIAVGVLAPSTWLDHRIHYLLKPLGIETGLLLSGTIVALTFGLTVRFMALAFNPLDASFEKNCRNLDEASRILGHSPLKTLVRINLPLLKPAILVAATLVFVDVIKELPLTLFLSPANFDTLATRAYELAAKEEAVREAAPVALLVIAAGLLPALLVNRLQKGEQKQS